MSTLNSAKKLIRRLFAASSLRPLPSVDAYALWAANYPPHAHNPLMQAEQAAMLDLLPPLAGRVVLDLACGTGRYGLLAQAQGARRVIGIDNSADMLRANPVGGRVQATSEAIPLGSSSIDVLVCGLALGHLPVLQPSLREIGRVLKPGGVALVSDLHPSVARSGGQRTFNGADGRVYAVEHYIHEIADYQQAGSQAGLRMGVPVESALADEIAKADGYNPIVLVLRFEKLAG